jgi:hypothetical protein
VVAQWIERQLASEGLVAKSCNTAPGGQEYAIGLHGLLSSF